MDNPFSPILGVTLEQYAELAAAMRGSASDPEACALIAERAGLDRDTWESVRSGWNARMVGSGAAGAVAEAYIELYRAAVEGCALVEVDIVHNG